jgi:uncharacterized membrane protein YgcG
MQACVRIPILLALVLLIPAAMAYPSPRDVPRTEDSACAPDKHFVFDYAGIVSAQQAQSWEQTHCSFYQKTGSHFVVITTKTTDGQALGPYAEGLFNYWGVGSAEKGDGLMLLYVQEDHEGYPGLFIAAGSGIIDVLTPDDSSAIYEDALDAKQAAESNGATKNAAIMAGMDSASYDVREHMWNHFEGGQFYAGRTPSQQAEFEESMKVFGNFGAILALVAFVGFVGYRIMAYRARREEERLEAIAAERRRVRAEEERKETEARLAWEASDDPEAVKLRRNRAAALRRAQAREAKEAALKAEARAAEAPCTVSCRSCFRSQRACYHGYSNDSIMTNWMFWFFVWPHIFPRAHYPDAYPKPAPVQHTSTTHRSSSHDNDHSSSSFGGFSGGGFGGSFGGGNFGGGSGGRF